MVETRSTPAQVLEAQGTRRCMRTTGRPLEKLLVKQSVLLWVLLLARQSELPWVLLWVLA